MTTLSKRIKTQYRIYYLLFSSIIFLFAIFHYYYENIRFRSEIKDISRMQLLWMDSELRLFLKNDTETDAHKLDAFLGVQELHPFLKQMGVRLEKEDGILVRVSRNGKNNFLAQMKGHAFESLPVNKVVFLKDHLLLERSTDSYRYILGLELDTDAIANARIKLLLHALLQGAVPIILALPFFILFLRYRNKTERSAKEMRIEEVYERVRSKEMLEGRIQDEVEKNRLKDHMILKQSRLAAMGEMISMIAHQWRQPLNAIGLLVQDIREAQRFGELTTEYTDNTVTEIREQLDYMSKTVEDFRSFFKPEKSKCEFSVAKAIHESMVLISPKFKNLDIVFTLDVEEGTDEFVNVYGYPNEFKQALINLLNNAADAIEEQRLKKGENAPVRGDVSIEFERIGEDLFIRIRDNGGGIPEKVMERIFDPYFTTKPGSKGTGVGLYMSKKIIEHNMNGAISVSNTEEGALFEICLPLSERIGSEEEASF